MRPLGLALLLIGLIGIVLGVLHAIGIPLSSGGFSHGTWPGVGPIIGGLGLAGLGTYLALRRA
ncbi:MAG: hypothetical protein M3Y31_08165 [Gemmatimonadota bacterium]|nr:hypothetical protein [Gemmatimonadota bacterium]